MHYIYIFKNRFLADADWDIVEKYILIEDPYHTLNEEAELDDLTNFERKSSCPKCTDEVPNVPSSLEWKDMQQEARLRLLKAEKVHAYYIPICWLGIYCEHNNSKTNALNFIKLCRLLDISLWMVDFSGDLVRLFMSDLDVKKGKILSIFFKMLIFTHM